MDIRESNDEIVPAVIFEPAVNLYMDNSVASILPKGFRNSNNSLNKQSS